MLRKSLVVAVALFVLATVNVYGQDAGAQARKLATALDKTKYKKKEKPMVSIEFYLDIKNEPAVLDAASYAGNYGSEDREYELALQVDRSGAASGTGRDWTGENQRTFTLKDASVSGALLTGTKVFANGEQERFEAVFVNRTVSTGKNENDIAERKTAFGLGFIQEGSRAGGDKGGQTWTNRVFLERK